jgi:hypothetical protein
VVVLVGWGGDGPLRSSLRLGVGPSGAIQNPTRRSAGVCVDLRSTFPSHFPLIIGDGKGNASHT